MVQLNCAIGGTTSAATGCTTGLEASVCIRRFPESMGCPSSSIWKYSLSSRISGLSEPQNTMTHPMWLGWSDQSCLINIDHPRFGLEPNYTIGGERGIRTPDTVSRILAFQASPFNHSGTSPRGAHYTLSAVELPVCLGRQAGQEGLRVLLRRCGTLCSRPAEINHRNHLLVFIQFKGTCHFTRVDCIAGPPNRTNS